MLRPFEHPTLSAYLKSVAAAVHPMLGTFGAIGGVLDSAGVVHIDSDDYAPDVLDSFRRWKLADEGTQRALSSPAEVIRMIDVAGLDWDLLEQDPMVNEWYYPNGANDTVAFVLQWPEDGAFASLEFHHERFGTTELNVKGAALLRLLAPSLRAGARLLYAVGDHRLALARDLDALGLPIAICMPDGTPVHLSRALCEVLDGDADRARILTHVRRVALAASGSSRASSSTAPPAPRAHDLVHSRTATYRVSAARATFAMALGASDVLVTVGRVSSTPLDAGEICARFGLTRREADVAERLGRGLRNAAIAAALGLSPYTVRRHTERVLAKLGVTNRAEVAARLHP